MKPINTLLVFQQRFYFTFFVKCLATPPPAGYNQYIVFLIFRIQYLISQTGVLIMTTPEQKHSGNSILRAAFVAISVLFQAGWLLLLALKLNQYSAYISLFTSILSLIVVVRLYSKHTTAALKMPWIMLILAFPVMGLCLYLLIEIFGDLGRAEKRLKSLRRDQTLAPGEDELKALESRDLGIANVFRYAACHADAPVYTGTKTRYYAEAADAFAAMKEDIRRAEKFIFLEYFIIEDGQSFRELRDILQERAGAGVEVRLMYDDVGSIGYVNWRYAGDLNRRGIQCRVVNPVIPVLNLFMNHRDHRKMTIIDGRVAYTGGYNLADEYFGITRPYGKWKDTGLRLEGEAVNALTATFLETWAVENRRPNELEKYQTFHSCPEAPGFVQPYADAPVGPERVAENVYLNLANQAKKSLYFITPYLIITDELNSALGLAAKRGVDVRIITPGIPDKKLVYRVTRSYYAGLARNGVRIFEYTPGFCHAKQCICDGEIASIGTSNLDYRSLYLHFENDVLLYGCEAVDQIRQDFDALFPQCQEVTDKYKSGRTAMLRTWQCLLRLFAPLL